MAKNLYILFSYEKLDWRIDTKHPG